MSLIFTGFVLQYNEANKFDSFSRDVVSTDSGNFGKGTKPLIDMFQWSWDKSGGYIDGAFGHKFNEPLDPKITAYKISDNKYELTFDIKNTASYVWVSGRIIQKFGAEVKTLSNGDCITTLNKLQQDIKNQYGPSKHLKVITEAQGKIKNDLGNNNYIDMECLNSTLTLSLYQ